MDNQQKQTLGMRLLKGLGLGSGAAAKAGHELNSRPSQVDAAVDAAVEGRSPVSRIQAITDRYTKGGGGVQPAVQHQEQETQAEAPKPFRF